MTLSCSCYDFDKGEHESWWEPGQRIVPPAGETCCECAAALPSEPCATILHWEVYEPDEPAPPEDVNRWPRFQGSYWLGLPTCDVLERHGEQMAQAIEDWRDAHGWDSDYERFERCDRIDYRCERCEDLAEAIEDLGYCMIGPGDLIDAHTEYVNDHARPSRYEDGEPVYDEDHKRPPEIMWRRDASGVWQPHRMTDQDKAKREVRRRWRNAVYFVWYGGWKTWLRWKVWPAIERRTVNPIMRRIGYERRYDYDARRLRWHRKDREVVT